MVTNVWNWYSELRRWFVVWIVYYSFFCTKAAIISSCAGLLTCSHLVEFVVVSVLTTYITQTLKDDDGKRPHILLIAATLNKVHRGLTAFFEGILIFIHDSHICGFKTVLFSSASYIAGLVILVFWKETTERIVSCTVAIIFLAIGSGGKETMKKFLSEQLRAIEPTRQPIEEDRVMTNTRLFDRVTWGIAFLVSVFLFGNLGWRKTFAYSASAMTFSYLIFLCGIPFYHREKATRRKQDLETSIGISEKTSSFRQATQECKSEFVIRFLLFGWIFSIILGIGVSTADTFFQEQADVLNGPISIFHLLLLQAISGWGFSILYDFILAKSQPADYEITESQKMLIRWIKIWIGMLLMVACLLVGWRVETYRHWEYKGKIPHLTLWLTLQFLLFGPAMSFGEDGLNNLLEEHLPDPLKKYGPSLNGFATGFFGSFFGIILVQVLRHWFLYDLKSSRLDKYFMGLAILNFINLSISFLWGIYTVKNGSAAVEPFVDPNPGTAEEEATQSSNGADDKFGHVLTNLGRSLSLNRRSWSKRVPTEYTDMSRNYKSVPLPM